MWRRVKTRTGGNAVLTLGPLAVPDAGPYDAIVPTPPSHSVADLQARLQSALGDAYHVEKELGGGGMSRVFLATEASLHRQVVIKLLPPEIGQRSERGALQAGDRARRPLAAYQHPPRPHRRRAGRPSLLRHAVRHGRVLTAPHDAGRQAPGNGRGAGPP